MGPVLRSIGFYDIYFSLEITITENLLVQCGSNVQSLQLASPGSSPYPFSAPSQGVNLDKVLYGVLFIACYRRQDSEMLRSLLCQDFQVNPHKSQLMSWPLPLVTPERRLAQRLSDPEQGGNRSVCE